jgi:hypothetical protein
MQSEYSLVLVLVVELELVLVDVVVPGTWGRSCARSIIKTLQMYMTAIGRMTTLHYLSAKESGPNRSPKPIIPKQRTRGR